MLQRQYWLAALVATLAGPSPVPALAADTNDLTAGLRLAVDRGEMLYIYDRAAWLGTDDFRGRYSKLMSNAGGYVITGDERQTDLAFYDKSKSRAVYRATFAAGKLAGSGPPASDRIELTALERRLILSKEKALTAFIEAKVATCAKANPNLAALPPRTLGGPILVYLMTPQIDLKVYPLGGHFSVEVGEDGSVGKVRHYTKTCIGMPFDQVPKGAKPVAFWITHLLDPTPTEIHVFSSLASGMPIYVGTKNQRTWAVEGSQIRSVDPK